jgi:DNA polymerase III alpha subunit
MTNQRVDDWGRVILTESGLLELFYNGIGHGEVLADDAQAMREFNTWCETFDKADKKLELFSPLQVTPQEYHTQRQAEWLIPDEYKNIDIALWLRNKCTTPQQLARVNAELELYVKHQMCDVLRLLLYITDTLRSNNVMWGVGRGSSVASYCLFLIGVHRIDSLKYDLPISEFIKES